MEMDRRMFLQSVGAAALCGCVGMPKEESKRMLFGVCAGNKDAVLLKEAGFDYIEGGVRDQLMPDASDEEFAPKVAELRNLALPMRVCNSFIPGEFKFLANEQDRAKALAYAVRACKHADMVDVKYIVFGSGYVRRVPDGADPVEYRNRFISFCKDLGREIKRCKVTVVLEPLNKGETNLLNTVAEGIEIVDAVDSPRIQLLADLFHMMRVDEGPDSIRKAGSRIKHTHIAEKAKRTVPGTDGDDFKPYFDALRDIGYTGGMSCECGWPKGRSEAIYRETVELLRTF